MVRYEEAVLVMVVVLGLGGANRPPRFLLEGGSQGVTRAAAAVPRAGRLPREQGYP